MFVVQLIDVRLCYAGCPEDGLAAVDWRRARGLEERPHNVGLKMDCWKFADEPLCRLRPELLDCDADLMVQGDERQDTRPLISVSPETIATLKDWNGFTPLSPIVRKSLAEVIQNYDPKVCYVKD